MIRKLMNEFTKVRFSRISYVMFISTGLIPIMIVMLVVILNSDIRYDSVTYLEYMSMILKFLVSFVGVIFYNWVASEIIGREFRMDTIKSQLTIPVERGSFVFVKLLFISIVLLAMTLSVFIIGTVISISMSMRGFTLSTVAKLLLVFLKAGFLMLPFAYFTVSLVLYFKKTLVPMAINMIVFLIVIATSNMAVSTVFPWTAPYHIIFMNDLNFSLQKSYLSIFLLGIISMYFSNRRINRMEI